MIDVLLPKLSSGLTWVEPASAHPLLMYLDLDFAAPALTSLGCLKNLNLHEQMFSKPVKLCCDLLNCLIVCILNDILFNSVIFDVEEAGAFASSPDLLHDFGPIGSGSSYARKVNNRDFFSCTISWWRCGNSVDVITAPIAKFECGRLRSCFGLHRGHSSNDIDLKGEWSILYRTSFSFKDTCF
jgi:hypothetical protein